MTAPKPHPPKGRPPAASDPRTLHRKLYCGCGNTIYRTEDQATAAVPPGDRPADVVSVYRCPGSQAWHVAPADGLPTEVLDSIGRRLAYELARNKVVDFSQFAQEVLGLDFQQQRNKWNHTRKKYAGQMVELGVAEKRPPAPDGPRSLVLVLTNLDAANRIVQVGASYYAHEKRAAQQANGDA